MKLYSQVFRIGLQNTFVYRWNFLLRAGFSIIPLFGLIYFWETVYGSPDRMINGYTYENMISYFLLALVVESLVTPSDDEWQIASEIRDGHLNMILLRPVNHLLYRLSLFGANRLTYVFVTLPPVFLVLFCFRQYLSFPSESWIWGATGLSILLAALLQFLIAYTLAMCAFWILEISTLVFIFFSCEYFFSGHLFPLELLPPTALEIIKWTPFPYELWFPISVFEGRIRGMELFRGLMIQGGWVIGIALLSQFLWRRGLRKYTASGG